MLILVYNTSIEIENMATAIPLALDGQDKRMS